MWSRQAQDATKHLRTHNLTRLIIEQVLYLCYMHWIRSDDGTPQSCTSAILEINFAFGSKNPTDVSQLVTLAVGVSTFCLHLQKVIFMIFCLHAACYSKGTLTMFLIAMKL